MKRQITNRKHPAKIKRMAGPRDRIDMEKTVEGWLAENLSNSHGKTLEVGMLNGPGTAKGVTAIDKVVWKEDLENLPKLSRLLVQGWGHPR